MYKSNIHVARRSASLFRYVGCIKKFTIVSDALADGMLSTSAHS